MYAHRTVIGGFMLALVSHASAQNFIIDETWSGPPGPFGGDFVDFFQTDDGNNWVVIGPSGSPTGGVRLTGDLEMFDTTPSLDGGNPASLVVNLDHVIQNPVITATVGHNAVNAGGLLLNADWAQGNGYFLFIDGSQGTVSHKSLEGGVGEVLGTAQIPNYDPSLDYGLEYSELNGLLTGNVFLSNQLIASVSAFDERWPAGQVGVWGSTSLRSNPNFPLSEHPLAISVGDFRAIPEPGTLLLFTLTALVGLRRRM